MRQILHEAAAIPREPLHVDRLLARARRRRRGPTVGLGVVVLALVGIIASLVGLPGREPDDSRPRPNVATNPVPFIDLSTGWTELPAPPEVRYDGATAWTGDTLFMWSGAVPAESSVPVADGFMFDTHTARWTQMAKSPLEPRLRPASAWTGEHLVVWGGLRSDSLFTGLGDGAAYDARRGTWRRLPPAPISARAPLSVWTGQELIVWGTAVRTYGQVPRDGAAYNPATNSWRRIAQAPVELTDATAAWTGHEMIVFGATLGGNNFPATRTAIGAAYDPATDTWRELAASTLSPQASTAAWNGRELIAWDYEAAAAAYDPARNTWRRLPRVPLEPAECYPKSVPVGDRVFGEFCGTMVVYDANTGQWREVSPDHLTDWSFELVAAGPMVVLLGRESHGAETMLAYHPAA